METTRGKQGRLINGRKSMFMAITLLIVMVCVVVGVLAYIFHKFNETQDELEKISTSLEIGTDP